MRFVVTGGGTGGHIYPALAIARGLQERYSGCEILYIGTNRGLEADIVPKAGLEFRAIRVAGLKRSLSPRNLAVFWQAARGLGEARRIMRTFRPAAVVGTGGYVCGPVVLAAAMGGIPTLIHEQNAFPGITNRILSRFARRVAVTFEDSIKYFPRRARVKLTGLPVRPEILQARRDEARQTLGLPRDATVILSFGGSQGARSINHAMVDLLGLMRERQDVSCLHVTGPAQYEEFMGRLEAAGINLAKNGNITITSYMYDMPNALAAADVAICRAGAATLAELTCIGLPAILIPYPYAAENHQEYNARALEKRGAALVIKDADLSGDRLSQCLEELLQPASSGSKRDLQAMQAASRDMGRPGALEDIVNSVGEIINN